MRILSQRLFIVVFLTVLLAAPLTAQAQVPRVAPQEAGPDGGLVHVVQFGDTLDGILNAYINFGVTIDSLLELNGWRFKPQFIFVDDQIIVLPPGSTEPGNGLPVPEDAAAEAAPPPPTAAPEGDAAADLSESGDNVTRGDEPAASGAPAAPAEVLSAEDITALTAIDVVAPFVPVLGDDSLIPEPEPPAPDVAQTAEAPPAEEAAQAGAIELIPTNTLIPESQPGPVQTEEASEEMAATEEMVAAEEAPPAADAADAAPTQAAILPTPVPDSDAPAPPAQEIAMAEIPADMPDFTRMLGQVCATFYDDINKNGRRDPDESPLAGGMVLVGDGASATTDDTGSACLVDLGTGSLEVQAAAPEGYGITSPDALRVVVASGQTTNLAFGASLGYIVPESLPAIEEILNAPVPESFHTESAAAATTQADADKSPLDQLYEVSGLIVLALGILVFSGGILLALWLRLVRR